MYLKNEKSTSASNIVGSILSKSSVPQKIDDPYEGTQPLNWYLNVLPNSLGVVIHFHTSESQKEKPVFSGRKALVAGLAHGLGLNTLLLAHSPYEPPLDYHDKIYVHKTASQCESILNEWIEPIVEIYKESEEDYKGYRAGQNALGKLSGLIMGDYVAENENQDLLGYFLETSEYKESLNSQQVLFVGRKGTGKTANLIKLKNDLSKDKRNFTVTVQPQGHESQGVLDILSRLISSSEQGHLIESIWKYLIYTEIARQYYEYLESQPLHVPKNEDEEVFLSYVKSNERYINADFTLRLDNIVNNLRTINEKDSIEEQRLKVSEFLHDTMIKHLRTHLGQVLHKREKVSILIDNLDRSWSDNTDLKKLSELLFGLLNVIHKITDEFQKNSYKHVRVNLSLIVFLRSDIFSRIMSYASERDKIPFRYLSWSEPNLLFRVIENRIEYSSSGVSSPEALWEKYFCEKVDGVPLRNFVVNLILSRPRDIVFLFKAALQEAVNKGHSIVEEEDFKSAEYSYSEYALQSLLPENGGRIKDFETILYEFAGVKSILTQEELEECLVGFDDANVDDIIKILCEMTFLGQEIKEGHFEHYSEKRTTQITDKLAQRLAKRNYSSKRYKIHNAFHSYLEIKKV